MATFKAVGAAPSDKRNAPSSARKMVLSSGTVVDCLSAGLHSVQGALEIIQRIKDRRLVTRLILSHNSLGDDGCEALFRFLCSDTGRSKRIKEIKLARNGLGNRGWLAISEYLRDNHVLEELYIPANEFTPDPAVISAFAAALNTSHLVKLNIGSHPTLSDTFIEHFLPALSSTHLVELHLTMLGLTYTSIQYIAAYIKDRSRCRHLRILLLNANNLECEGITDLVTAIATGNWGLMELELYSNTSDQAAAAYTKILKQLLLRNQILKSTVAKEATGLLRPARGLLLPAHEPPTTSRPSPPLLTEPHTPQLPTEIYLHILSFLAPTLSPSQHISIFSHASSYGTLPPLLPKLFPLDSGCVPDPTNSPLGLVGGKRLPLAGRNTQGCMEGCMKGIVCQREVLREQWLTAVGCDVYEPVPVP